MADGDIQNRIKTLIEEEHDLRDRRERDEISDAEEHTRLSAVEVELDQCCDLLRQRRALRQYGNDPDEARVRPAAEVEGYRS